MCSLVVGVMWPDLNLFRCSHILPSVVSCLPVFGNTELCYSESSQRNRILHNTEVVRKCRSHICHHTMFITVNPFTPFKAGTQTWQQPGNIFIHLCLSCFTQPSSHCVSYVCWQCLTVSCPPVCVAPPANPLPASAKMGALLKQSSQLTFLAPGAPWALPLGPLRCSSRSDPASAPQWQRRCVELGWDLWMWRDVGPLVFLPEEPKSVVVFMPVFVCVFICVPCVRGNEIEWERGMIRKWTNESAPLFCSHHKTS